MHSVVRGEGAPLRSPFLPPGRGPPKAVLARDSVSRLPPHRSPPRPLSRSPSPAPTRRSPSPNLNSLSVPAEFRAGPSPSCSQGNPFKPPAGGSGPPSPVPTTHQGPVLFPDTPPFPSHPGLSPNPEPPDRSPAGLSWPLRPSPAPLSLPGQRPGRSSPRSSRGSRGRHPCAPSALRPKTFAPARPATAPPPTRVLRRCVPRPVSAGMEERGPAGQRGDGLDLRRALNRKAQDRREAERSAGQVRPHPDAEDTDGARSRPGKGARSLGEHV